MNVNKARVRWLLNSNFKPIRSTRTVEWLTFPCLAPAESGAFPYASATYSTAALMMYKFYHPGFSPPLHRPPDQTEIRPNPTKSNLIKPNQTKIASLFSRRNINKEITAHLDIGFPSTTRSGEILQ
jgi:hypothetical protein